MEQLLGLNKADEEADAEEAEDDPEKLPDAEVSIADQIKVRTR